MPSSEIPGPVWHENVSHGTQYDHENELFYVVAIVAGHRIRSRVRPMCRSEKINSRLREFSREEVLETFGIDENWTPPPVSKIRPWWKIW